jgi:MSHA biogenesis protein MshK
MLLAAVLGASAAAAAPELKDPTRPYRGAPAEVVSSPNMATPRLTSVLLGERRRLAVIDGQLVREGETLRGMTVLEIASDRAIVSIGGSRMTLALDEAQVRKEIR